MESPHGSSRATRKQATGRGSAAAEVGSIVLFALAVFAVFALLTYHSTDPSPLGNATGSARNACGKVGAWFASVLLEAFGIAAFLTPAALVFMAATVLKREGSVKLIGLFGGMIVATIALTVFLSLQWKYWPYSGSLLLTGGVFGAWLSDLLSKQFNIAGATIVSLLVFALSLALSTPLSVARVIAKILKAVSKVAWIVTRKMAVYAGYMIGLAAMRAAQVTSDQAQKMIEAAIRKAKERKEARRAAAALEAAGIAGIDAGQEAVIGMDVPVGAPAGAAKIENEGPRVLTSTFYSEAPNALPDLEIGNESAAAAKSVGAAGAEIVLPEKSGDAAKENAKADARLLRLARAKRGAWKLPAMEFLHTPPKIESLVDEAKLRASIQILEQKLTDFGIEGKIIAARPGPVITLFEYKPGPGVKLSRIAALADDLSMALSAQSVRILAPLPGKAVVGIEVPSETRQTVYLKEFLQHPDFYGKKHSIPIVMGKDIGGQPYLSDLARMPHLLCAGQTGAGKSVFMNSLICSLLYRFTPDELRMVLVDPKFIEFRAYQEIPHLLLPVVDEPKNASVALKWAVREMDRRYRILAMMGVRNLESFNQKVDDMGADVVRDLLFSEESQPEGISQMTGRDWIESFEPGEDDAPKVGKLPYIVVIVDELADLMMVAKKDVEISIARIAQKARAAGIHLVAATQRPSTDVVTGLIKANLPSRVSFQLASYVDSKTILDRAGAERLLGRGDMLFIPPGMSHLMRLHGALVDDGEIEKITAFLRSQGKPLYREEILIDDEEDDFDGEDDSDGEDELFSDAVDVVKRLGHASASSLQRRFSIGYNRAARIVDEMEKRGMVGPADGSKPREVLIR